MEKNKQGKKTSTLILEDLLFLLLKIGILVGLLLVMYFYVFGIYRITDNTMFPAVRDGDLTLFYRLQDDFNITDVVVVEKDGETQVRRIIAKAGDTVDIVENGLMVNGNYQQERGIYTETLPYKEGITYPITIGTDEYFVLADDRTNAKDSRIYGTVKKEEIKGNVMTVLRRRGF